MTDFGIDSTGIHLLAITFHWYGIILVTAGWIAAEVAEWLASRQGYEPEHVWRALIRIILLGLIGARLWYVFFPPDSVVANGLTAGWLLSHFLDLNQGVIAIYAGGLGLIGGIVGGTLGLYLYTRRKKLPFFPWLDLAAIVLPLAQAVGRLGNGVNQDLYGPVTTLPWGMLVSDETQRLGPYTDLARYPLATAHFHPVYAYEALWMALVFAVLMGLFLRYRQRLQPGTFALIYVVLYGMGRAVLEFLRVNVSHVGGVNVSQVAAALAAALALIVLIRWRPIMRPPTGSLHSFDGRQNESSLQLGQPE